MSELVQRRSRGGEQHGGGSTAPEVMLLLRRRRERELMAQLHDLLFPPAPAPSGAIGIGVTSSSSSGLNNNYDDVVVAAAAGQPAEDDERSPVSYTVPPPPPPAGWRRGRRISGRKRPPAGELQDGEDGRDGAGATVEAAPPPAEAPRRSKRRKKQGSLSTTIVTTVPDFDGYQWRKYGQKHIEAAKHTRSYYRCTNSTEQGCPAKRTVQRNDGGGGGPPKYTVVYISEHTCKMAEESALQAPPVILETTVRAPAPDPAVVAADVPAAESSTTNTADVSPVGSDITTWSGGDFSHVFAAGDDCCWEHPAAAVVLEQEMDQFAAGPIRSPVHVVAAEFSNWSYGLFVNELSSVPSSCHLFGF